MAIANIPIPQLRIPPSIEKGAEDVEIVISSTDVPYGATEWIACCSVWPHIDPDWVDFIF